MRRHLPNLLTALSLLLLIAGAAAWVASYARPVHWGAGSPADAWWEVFSARGTLRIERVRRVDGDRTVPASRTIGPRSLRYTREDAVASRPAASAPQPPSSSPSVSQRNPNAAVWKVWCDYWVPCLVGSVLPVWRLARLPHRRAARRRARGECVGCGYDLRGSADRCPECGREFAALPPRFQETP
jgi:hypothetical protein